MPTSKMKITINGLRRLGMLDGLQQMGMIVSRTLYKGVENGKQ
jgi:hypothetical protein